MMHGLIAALLMGVAHPALAQTVSGNELLETCESDDEVLNGFCIGYTLGVIEGESFGAFLVINSFSPGLDTNEMNAIINGYLQHCTPGDASNKQVGDIVGKYLVENPARRHNSARTLILEALRDAFPCD